MMRVQIGTFWTTSHSNLYVSALPSSPAATMCRPAVEMHRTAAAFAPSPHKSVGASPLMSWASSTPSPPPDSTYGPTAQRA